MNSTSLPLSICMIVKNEEENLERCFKSIRNLTDDIVIVDTGSTDNTLNLAHKSGARVFHFQWTGSFAAARNFSISKAKHKIVLCLDADEELVINNINQFKAALAKLQEAPGLMLPVWSYTGDTDHTTIERSSSLRIFPKDCYYRGKIHEQPTLPGQPLLLDEAIALIKHYGYLAQASQLEQKVARNIQILEQELAADSENPFLLYYIGNEYLRMGVFPKAVDYFRTALAFMDPQIVSFYNPLIKKYLVSLIELKEYAEALELIETGLSHYADYTDLYYLKGQIKHSLQNYPEAIASFRKCLELGEPPCYFVSTQGVGSYKAAYSLGVVYQDILDKKLAIQCYLRAIELNPTFYYPIYNLIAIKLKEGPTKLEKFIEKYFDTDNEHTILPLTTVLKNLNQYGLAVKYLRYLYLKDPQDIAVNFKLGLCYFYLRKPFKACKFLAMVPENNPYSNQASKYKYLSLLIAKRTSLAQGELMLIQQQEQNKELYPVLKLLVDLIKKKEPHNLKLSEDFTVNLNLGLSLVEDFLTVKKLKLTTITISILKFLFEESVLVPPLVTMLFKYTEKELAFSLILNYLNKDEFSSEVLTILKELIKERAYLDRFNEFVNQKATSNNSFNRKLQLLSLRLDSIHYLSLGLKSCPNSELIRNHLDLVEERFLQPEEETN